MQRLVIVLSLVVLSNALDKEFVDGFIAKVKSFGDECLAESSASKDDINSLFAHKVPESHEGKCLLFCFHKRFHIQNEDGSLDRPGAIQALEPLRLNDAAVYDKVLTVFKTCADKAPVDSDPCLYTGNLAECAVREGKALSLDELMVVEFE